jgi:hypothetical protein
LGLFWIGGGGIGSLKDWLRATAGDVVSFVILFKVDFNIEEVPAGLLAEFVEGSDDDADDFGVVGDVCNPFLGEGIFGLANWATK